MQQQKKRKLDNTLVSRPHPLEIRPEGNILLLTNEERKRAFDARKSSLGAFSVLPDALIYSIVGEIGDSESVRNFGFASKFAYAFAWQDELWKELFVEDERAISEWKGTWRRSYWGLSRDSEASVTCSIIANGHKTYLYSDMLYRPFQCSQVDFESYIKRGLGQLKSRDKLNIERISRQLTESEFQSKSNQPFILTKQYPRGDGTEMCSWDESRDLFSVEKLVEKFGHVIFRQECVDWPLGVYEGYMKDNVDESPLYLFDCRSVVMRGTRDERSESRDPLIEQSSESRDIPKSHDSDDSLRSSSSFRSKYIEPYIPDIFKTDLFTLCGSARPDFSWMIIGPRNSGSTFHKDPNSTCAWNSILKGAKYWVMFPPHVTPPGIYTDGEESEVTSPCSLAEWFLGGFYNDVVMEGLAEGTKDAPFLHGMCEEGETMYVPAGWWHMVVNVCESECVAVTQNFIPRGQKLVEALKFLRDKPDQISGFRCEQVEKWGEKLGVQGSAIYDLFVKVLESSEYKGDVEEALEKLPKKKEVREKSMWGELTEEKGFSFGFV